MPLQVSALTGGIALYLILLLSIVSSQETRDAHHLVRETAHDLGILPVQLYAKAPVLLKEKVLLLNVWLKRVTQDDSSGQDGRSEIHGFAWAEDMDALNRSQEGHMLMGVDQNVWQPRLRLETPRGTVVDAQSVRDVVKDPQAKSSLRPFHFTFPLDPAHPGRCFKLYEESFPGYRFSFCLPLTSTRLCRRLVSEETEALNVPALWSVIFPLRSTGINGTHWDYHTRLIANRIFNYAAYQIGIGGAGVLLYADRMTRAGLERVPRIVNLISKGRLILVTWDMPERSPMAYKYDQALVASHALLGLSACGPRLMLLLADMDEYLYSAFGHGWPSIYTCLARADARTTLYRLQRIDAGTSRMDPTREATWWVVPARSLARHPIMAYDRLKRQAMRPELSKVLAVPSGRIVGFYVHDGFPMYGATELAGGECGFLLHIPNYWGPRAAVAAAAAVGGGGGVAAVAATEDSAAAATVAAARGGALGAGSLGDSLESLFDTDGTTDAAGGGGSAGGSSGSSAASHALDADYTPFKVSATWAVSPTATAALEGQNGILTAVGNRITGGREGISSAQVGSLRRFGHGTNGGDGSGSTLSSGVPGDDRAVATRSGSDAEVGAGTMAAATLAAANAAALVVAAAASSTSVTKTAVDTGDESQGLVLADAGGATAAASSIAAEAARLAALAAEKAKEARLQEMKVASLSSTGLGNEARTETASLEPSAEPDSVEEILKSVLAGGL